MAHVNVNLNVVEDQKPHEEGMLHVRVMEAEIRDNNAGDGQYVNWRLDPVEGDNKSPVWLMTSLKPKALFVLKAFLKAARVQWNEDGTFDTDEAIGREVFVMVKQEEYNGEIKNRVDRPFKEA